MSEHTPDLDGLIDKNMCSARNATCSHTSTMCWCGPGLCPSFRTCWRAHPPSPCGGGCPPPVLSADEPAVNPTAEVART